MSRIMRVSWILMPGKLAVPTEIGSGVPNQAIGSHNHGILQKPAEFPTKGPGFLSRDHGSFASNHRGKLPGDVVNLNGMRQVLWPNHCVQNTRGAEFVPGLDMSRVKNSGETEKDGSL